MKDSAILSGGRVVSARRVFIAWVSDMVQIEGAGLEACEVVERFLRDESLFRNVVKIIRK